MNITPSNITSLRPNEIFVFGSNLKGHHGRGAAAQAVDFNAEYGVGEGFTGQTYALPTKEMNIRDVRNLEGIQDSVYKLYAEVRRHPELHFLITPVGCGLAGFSPKHIAPMFKDFVSLPNVSLPIEFWAVLNQPSTI